MIKFTMQDLHRNSPRCADLCERYVETGCGTCTLRFRTAFKCPHCKTVSHYYGTNSPMTCQTCKRVLPDLYAIAQVKHHYVRVKYHLEATSS
jgi:hypothetical protein